MLLKVGGIVVLCGASAAAQEPAKRAEWDQKKALDIIKGVVALEKDLEKTGKPWDKIAWLTDADQAIARAKKENKAIIVYCYCNDGKGPAAAPC